MPNKLQRSALIEVAEGNRIHMRQAKALARKGLIERAGPLGQLEPTPKGREVIHNYLRRRGT
jgi:hypothetical protein